MYLQCSNPAGLRIGNAARPRQIERLWRSAQPTLAAYLASVVSNRHDANDLLQEIAVVCIEKFDRFDPKRPFVNWALGIARYEVLAYRRRRATDRHVFDTPTIDLITESFQSAHEECNRYGDSLSHCMKRLTRSARTFLEMRYADDLTPTEIAARNNRPLATINMALYRTRKAIRTCMENRTNGPLP